MKDFSLSETLDYLRIVSYDIFEYVVQKISQLLVWTDKRMHKHFDIYLFLKYLSIYFIICCVSSIGLSWVVLSIIYLVLIKEKKDKMTVRLLLAYMNTKMIKSLYKSAPKERPSWVTFPDMERVEWLNKIIRQLWPYAGHYVKDLCKYSIEPSIRTALEDYKLAGFQFEKIILGDTPPRFSGVKVYDDTSRHEIIMDMDFAYAGDCKFEVSVSKFKMGIKDLRICGKMRVVMKPLVKQIPLVGGLQVFFLNNPDVDFNLIGLADVFDMPGLSDILRSIVTDQIGYMMVLPNRYPIQLVEDIDIAELKCPLPAGVIRIHVIEAHNLMKKDVGIMGMGKSDPYCILHLGAQKFQTKTINNTINPKWDFCCEFVCSSDTKVGGVAVEFNIFDQDILSHDDFLLRANLDVQEIWKSGEIDMWVPLSDAKSGRLHIRATWLELSEAAPSLDLQLEEIRALQNTTKNPLHSAVLMVWVDSAKKLNPSHKTTPDPFVRLHVGNTKHETTVRQRTNDPVFEEGFSFLVRNPKTQELQVEVIDQKTSAVQGKLELDLNLLLKEKNLEIIGEDYSLSGASGGLAAIKLSLTLRILKTALKTDDGDGGPKEKGEVETSSFTPAAISDPPSSSSASVPQPPAPKISSKALPSTPPPHPADVPEAKSALTKEDVSVADPSDVSNVATHADVPPPANVEERKPSVETTVEEVMASAASPLMHMLPSATEGALRQRTSTSPSGVHGLGRIELSVKYGPRNNLVVVVHQVQGLEKEEDGELPDPYVKLYLLPDRSKDSKRKTDVIKDDCNPKFDERFEYSVSPNELTHRRLEVSVINKKGLMFLQRSSTMGQIHLDCGLLDAEKVTQWYDLAPAMDEDEE